MSLSRSLVNALRSVYRRMFRRQEDTRTREAVAVLNQVSLFQGLSRGALTEVSELMHRRNYRRDEFIYYANDPGLGLYIVQRGRVRLLVEDAEGGVYELWQAGEADFFGVLSILGDFRRMETAQAVTEAQVLGFFSPDLKTLIKRNPSLGAAVIEALARHQAEQQVTLVERMAEEEGLEAALRLLYGLTARTSEVSGRASQVAP